MLLETDGSALSKAAFETTGKSPSAFTAKLTLLSDAFCDNFYKINSVMHRGIILKKNRKLFHSLQLQD